MTSGTKLKPEKKNANPTAHKSIALKKKKIIKQYCSKMYKLFILKSSLSPKFETCFEYQIEKGWKSAALRRKIRVRFKFIEY